MNGSHETVADIILEKRCIAAEIRSNLSIVPLRREDQLLEADSLDRESDRLEAAWKRVSETAEKSSAVGNSAALLEALEEVLDKIDKWRTDGTMEHWMYSQLFYVCDAALSAPPRQCDVGTAEEQQDRFRNFCRHYESEGECGIGRSEASCPAFRGGRNPDCSLWWAQMPYEEGALSESQVVQESPAASQE